MLLKQTIASSFWAAALTLTMPVMQAQAEECVKVNGLNHCGLGEARVAATGKGVEVENADTSGESGVAIQTGPAMVWTGTAFIESDESSSKTVFSAMSKEVVTSTVTVEQDGDKTLYSANFTGAGAKSGSGTHSIFIYLGGQPQASLGLVRGGIDWSIWHQPGLGLSPECRPTGQSYFACSMACQDTGYFNCDYCWAPCRFGFSTMAFGLSEWRFQLAHQEVHLQDGRVVRGDEVVIREEGLGSTTSPVQGFDLIQVQTTARKAALFEERVVNICSGQ